MKPLHGVGAAGCDTGTERVGVVSLDSDVSEGDGPGTVSSALPEKTKKTGERGVD